MTMSTIQLAVHWTTQSGFVYEGGGWNTTGNKSLWINESQCNYTNSTASPGRPKSPYQLWQAIIIIVILSLLTIGTIIGNILVCTAVAIVRKLRTPSNILIVSLAVSDLLVAILVMPFAAAYEVMGIWVLGDTFCGTWTSLDVMLCTASILNLCVISVDRYFVITRPFQYAMKRTPPRMAIMITCVWVSSALVSIPPLFGWKTESRKWHCVVSQAIGYQFYATIGAFYLPLAVMIVIYYRIYMVSSRIAQAEAKSKPSRSIYDPNKSHLNCNTALLTPQDKLPNGTTEGESPKRSSSGPRLSFSFLKRSRLNRIASSRERKATKTLGVIMGAFTACWLPFFILALIKPFCPSCVPAWLNSIFNWLGYANSFLNPIIYARFNREFRTPFKEILLGRCLGINDRLRNESYVEQYGSGPAHVHLRDHTSTSRIPVDTVVRYNNNGQAEVKLGNGNTAKADAKL